MSLTYKITLMLSLFTLFGCEAAEEPQEEMRYLGAGIVILDDDLVNFFVRVENPRTALDIGNYAICAAAQYTHNRGYGFARHVRTNFTQEGGIWTGDAIYTVSPDVPIGVETIEAAVTLTDCKARGIATV